MSIAKPTKETQAATKDAQAALERALALRASLGPRPILFDTQVTR